MDGAQRVGLVSPAAVGTQMSASRTIRASLAGVTATIESSYTPFSDYAEQHLVPLRSAEGGRPRIEARLRWHEGPPGEDRQAQFPELAGMDRIDRDLYRGNDALAWFRIDELPGLRLRFHWDGSRLSVEGDYFHWLSKDRRRDQLKRAWFRRRLPELRRRRFTTLLYYLLYYPSYWILERSAGFHPIHAAGVEIEGRIVVLAGPSGVGKSTLAAALAATPEARFLSDTFLLQHEATVQPVREPLLLDIKSRLWLGDVIELLQPIQWRYCLARRGYHWPTTRLSEGGSVALVLFPQRTAKVSLRRVAARQAHGRISAANAIINDLRRYWALAGVLEMLDPSPLAAAREEQIASLVSSVPCYEIGLSQELGRDETVRTVRELLTANPSVVDSHPKAVP